MQRVRSALTKAQVEAVKTARSATTLVQGMNRELGALRIEISELRQNYADLQDKYEKTKEKYHKADKANSILSAVSKTALATEIIKYLLTAVGTSYGINLASNNNKWGWLIVLASGIGYIWITRWQLRSMGDSKPIKRKK